MARNGTKKGWRAGQGSQAKYDAHHTVLEHTYGALASLRRELADTPAQVAERTELLRLLADSTDSQRTWLLLEDYFSKLALTRKDFNGHDWWARLLAARGRARLEELAMLFLRLHRSVPPELVPCANLDRLVQVQQQEQEQVFVQQLEAWTYPPAPAHLEAPRASLRVEAQMQSHPERPALNRLALRFYVSRPRTGEKPRAPAELAELTVRAAHEQELFAPADWVFIQWLARECRAGEGVESPLWLTGARLFQWLVRWGHVGRLELGAERYPLVFEGELIRFEPALIRQSEALLFTQQVATSAGEHHALSQYRFFDGQPCLALWGHRVYIARSAPEPDQLHEWLQRLPVKVDRLSHRFLAQLRKNHAGNGTDWDQVCRAHPAQPQFRFELVEEAVRLRLNARSDLDQSLWQWNGHDWHRAEPNPSPAAKPEFLDDPRLEPATRWLKRLDWFTPEPGLWVGDAHDSFLGNLAAAWPERPERAEYSANPAFQRLFLTPRRLRPHLHLQGSGIDWLSVSAEWEQEGLRLTPADLERLATATGRFVKLPDTGWVQLDADAVQLAHEFLADLGLEALSPLPQRVGLLQAAHLSEAALDQFGDSDQLRELRRRLAQFDGVPVTPLPDSVRAELRPYQKEGFNFLCHLSSLKLGGVLADDMGLGKTLQTLAWLAWLREQAADRPQPFLVICPASVLHNWRREAERFAPSLRVLVLESGAARHNLRQQIPLHDLIVTNYALLRRDLAALQKFSFRAIILDEAQFIKNPAAQITQSVKQLRAEYRLALTGTPLENRLLDLWSIVDFIQPGYLGTQASFTQKFEPRTEDGAARALARRRLSARLRPFLLRRLKSQVARDLPERIEQRHDCPLGEVQRQLYLAELRRSREQVFHTLQEQGLAKSRIHVLAALTRLRQICCHPQLVGSDADSGKTAILFELLDPLLEEGQKVLVFSQFVQMLRLLERECELRQIPHRLLSGATRNRQEMVQEFQEAAQPGVFLLSLRAAGTGLNLTAASYVVLYDPWWNPAVEAQAIDRSHRIGQTHTVNAYRLIAPGTVEEKIWNLQQHKAQTIADVLGETGFARSLSAADLEYLFAEA